VTAIKNSRSLRSLEGLRSLRSLRGLTRSLRSLMVKVQHHMPPLRCGMNVVMTLSRCTRPPASFAQLSPFGRSVSTPVIASPTERSAPPLLRRSGATLTPLGRCGRPPALAPLVGRVWPPLFTFGSLRHAPCSKDRASAPYVS